MHPRLYLFLLLLAPSILLPAQTRWEATFLDTTWSDHAYAWFETPGEHRHLLHFGAQVSPGEEFRKYTMLLDPKGKLLALDTAAQHLQSFTGPYFFPLQDSTARMLGYWDHPDSTLLWKSNIDNSLNHVWQGAVEVPYAGYTLMPNDSTILVARDKDCGIRLFRAKLNGEILWQTTVEETDLGNCAGYYQTVSVLPTADGGYLVGATFRDFFPNNYYLYLLKFDAADSLIWKQQQEIPSVSSPHLAQSGGNYYVLVQNALRKFDPAGTPIWTKNMSTLLGNVNYVSADLLAIADGSLVLTGASPVTPGQGNVFWAKFDTAGTLLQLKFYGKNDSREEGLQAWQMADGGFFISAKRFFHPVNDMPADAFFIRTDADGNSESNLARGKIFMDDNENCLFDAGELGVAHQNVRYTDNGTTRYARSDFYGNFSLSLHEGSFIVGVESPGAYFDPCWTETTQAVTQHDTLDLFFPMKPKVHCALLETALASTGLVPCEEVLFKVKYGNAGTASSEPALVEVQLDTVFQLLSADLPYAAMGGGIYQFEVGSLVPGETGEFGFWALLPCDSVFNQVYCAYARISPNDLCLSDPDFDIEQPHWSEYCRASAAENFPRRKFPLEGTETKITRDSIVSYLIHFENRTGGVLNKIVIMDTISANLQIQTIEPGAASHPFTFEFVETGAIRFSLENAAMPDTSVSALEAQGFVSFKIRQTPGLTRASSIKNNAWVRLDQLPSIKTNTVSQAVTFPIHAGEFSDTICAGDLYKGIAYFSDTTVQHLTQLPLYDSLLISHLIVLPAPETNLIFNSTGWVMHNDWVFYGDTVITEIYPAANGCDSTVTLTFNVVNSLDESSRKQQIQVFPNPAGRELFIRLNLIKEEYLIGVINSVGQKMAVRLIKSTPDIYRMEVGDWQAGVYFIQLLNPHGVISKRVVIN